MHSPVTHRRHMRASLGALVMSALCATAAHAQSYSYTVLKDPAGSTSCGPFRARLSDTGDVLASCYYPQTNLSGLLASLLTGQATGSQPLKPVVWRGSGTTDVLQGSAYGLLSNGQVLGSVPSLFNSNTWTDVVWTGKTRATWKPPVGVTGTWKLFTGELGVSPRGGAYLIYKSTSTLSLPQLAAVFNGAAVAVPSAPAACHLADTKAYTDYAVNNNGVIATLARWTITNAFLPINDPDKVLGYAQVCRWSSQAGWVLGPAIETMKLGMSASISTPVELTDITEANEVLIVHEQLGAVTWGSAPSWQPRDARFTRGGANGELLGRYQASFDVPGRAMLLRNGQAIDLNSQVSLPADLILTRALATNKKGQILCEATPVPGMGTKRTVVLTPK